MLGVARGKGSTGSTIVRIVVDGLMTGLELFLPIQSLPLRVWFFMQSKVSVRESAEDLKLSYNTVYRAVGELRLNPYLKASTIKLQRVVGLDEVYVTAGLKGKRGLRRKSRIRGFVRLIPMAHVAAKAVLRHLFKSFNLNDVEATYNCLESLNAEL